MKKNIVLLHGWGANITKLQPLAKSLQKIGWQTLVLKLPGFDAPLPKKPWSLENYANFVLEKTHTHLGEEFFIFGHSFGGHIAVQASLIDKNDYISGLVLCATAGFSRPHFLKRQFFLILAKIGKIFLYFSPRLYHWSKNLLYKLVQEHDYEKTTGVMRETFQKVIAKDLKPLVSKVNKPTLLLWGEEDRLTPTKDMDYILKHTPQSQAVTFANQGHKLPYNMAKKLSFTINQWFLHVK